MIMLFRVNEHSSVPCGICYVTFTYAKGLQLEGEMSVFVNEGITSNLHPTRHGPTNAFLKQTISSVTVLPLPPVILTDKSDHYSRLSIQT